MFKQVHKLLLFLALLWALAPPSTQAQVINCPSGFSPSGPCGVSNIGASGQPFRIVGTQSASSPGLSGSKVLLLSKGADHAALSLNYQTQVNVQAFTASFTFIPNGQNVSLIFNNNTNNTYFPGSKFAGGAGCEADFFQGFGGIIPNNVFALELDSYSPLTVDGSFSYSSAQIYQSGESPCLPNLGGTGFTYVPITKISTSPVPLNSPVDTPNTTTGDTYSATVVYDGSNFTLNLYDVTAGGSCPGSSCFTNTWTGVNIPSWVDGDMSWVGFGGATNSLPGGSIAPLYINSFVYNAGTPTSTPTPTPTPTVTPTVSPSPTPPPPTPPPPTPSATSTPTPMPSPKLFNHHKKWYPPPSVKRS